MVERIHGKDEVSGSTPDRGSIRKMNMKRLYRSRTNKVVAGVCGGIGEYFNIDPVIPRIIFLLVALPGGISILVYFIFWLLIPKSPKI